MSWLLQAEAGLWWLGWDPGTILGPKVHPGNSGKACPTFLGEREATFALGLWVTWGGAVGGSGVDVDLIPPPPQSGDRKICFHQTLAMTSAASNPT